MTNQICAMQGLREAEANKAQKQERVEAAEREARDASNNLRQLNTRIQELKRAHGGWSLSQYTAWSQARLHACL